MLSYEGLFFDQETVDLIHSLEEKQLPNINDEIHCTFKYHPSKEEIFNDIVGQSFEVYLIGYGNDGFNSGFQIALPNELVPYYLNCDDERKLPHITASLQDNSKAKDTKNLNFKPLKKPIKIIGRFGYWIKEENKEYLSYAPFNEKELSKKLL